jgi:chromate reductase, NAD(P)H dehydrogenase (quinone)
MTPKLLAIGGSLRKGSYNKLLARAAADAARRAGAEVTVVDLKELALPVYDGDDEEASGLPAGAKRLKKLMVEADGFLISTPEYNSSVPGGLKNAIDWASRAEGEEKELLAFRGKSAALFSASPGALGGIRSLAVLRTILSNIGVLVIPQQLALPKAHEAFDEAGALKDPKRAAAVEANAKALVELVRKLKA